MDEESKEELEKQFHKTLTEYFSSRWVPTGFFNTVGAIRDNLEKLNKNLEASTESSEHLAKALDDVIMLARLLQVHLLCNEQMYFCLINNRELML